MFDAIIGGISRLAGGFLDNKAAGDRNAAVLADKENDRALQMAFAKNGIQWRVEDAKKAGIHPIYALGGSTATYTPSAISLSGGSSMADTLGSVGQDIGRAINSTRSNTDKADAYTDAMKKLTLQKAGLENDLLASQIRKLNQAGVTPGVPTDSPKLLVDGQPATQVFTPDGAPVKADDIEQKADTAPANKRIRPAGIKLHTNPYFTDAEDLENRYGEVGENVGGVINFGADSLYTIYQGILRHSRSYPEAQKKFNRYLDYATGRR